ncbi:MAG: hypothetical protein ACK40G_08815 [Cytophagaceae bacterium]
MYIIIGIIYLISQIRKAAKKSRETQETGAPPFSPTEPARPREKPMTLEDMLKDLQMQMEEEKPVEQTKPAPVVPVSRPRPDFNKPMLRKEKIEEKKIEYKPEVSEFEDEELLAEQTVKSHYERGLAYKNDRISLPDEHLEHYTTPKTFINPYAAMLKNPQTLKQAIVLSTIMERKYQ